MEVEREMGGLEARALVALDLLRPDQRMDNECKFGYEKEDHNIIHQRGDAGAGTNCSRPK